MPDLIKDLESRVLKVNMDLNKQDKESFEAGLHELNELLRSMLPMIEDKRRLMTINNTSNRHSSTLYRFTKLQDNFRYNITLNMVKYLEWIYEHIDELDVQLVVLYNRLLQGLLLIHSQSRSIFSNTKEITQLLKFIEKDNSQFPYEITISFITTLLHVLLKNLDNFRIFEECKGCSIIIRKLKISDFSVPEKSIDNKSHTSKSGSQQMLNFKIIEFLIFYLSDEENLSEYSNNKKTVKEKSDFFREDLPDIDNLIESLNDLNNI